MNIRILKNPLLAWPEDILLQLVNLTLPGDQYDSNLKRMLIDSPESLVTWVAFDNNTPIGWGVKYLSTPVTMFYVLPKYRRNKIGTQIARAILKETLGNSRGCEWNHTSSQFFKSIPMKSYNWW